MVHIKMDSEDEKKIIWGRETPFLAHPTMCAFPGERCIILFLLSGSTKMEQEYKQDKRWGWRLQASFFSRIMQSSS